MHEQLHGQEEGQEQIFTSQKPQSSEITPQEVLAVYYHLTGTVDEFHDENRPLTHSQFKTFLRECAVYEVTVEETERIAGFRDRHDDAGLPRVPVWQTADIAEGGRYLYQSDTPSDYCTIVLDGKVCVKSGRDQFTTTLGRWSVVCSNLFQFKKLAHERDFHPVRTGVYLPDFDCKVVTSARILRLPKSRFTELVSNFQRPRKGSSLNPSSEQKTVVSAEVEEVEPAESAEPAQDDEQAAVVADATVERAEVEDGEVEQTLVISEMTDDVEEPPVLLEEDADDDVDDTDATPPLAAGAAEVAHATRVTVSAKDLDLARKIRAERH
jgi:hypothetical protein